MITTQKYGHWWEQSSSGSIVGKVSIGWWTRHATFQNMNRAASVEGLMSLPYCWYQCRLQSLVSILESVCLAYNDLHENSGVTPTVPDFPFWSQTILSVLVTFHPWPTQRLGVEEQKEGKKERKKGRKKKKERTFDNF